MPTGKRARSGDGAVGRSGYVLFFGRERRPWCRCEEKEGDIQLIGFVSFCSSRCGGVRRGKRYQRKYTERKYAN